MTGSEECDDGNNNDGDGCAECKLEPGFLCASPGSICQASVCGDGISGVLVLGSCFFERRCI